MTVEERLREIGRGYHVFLQRSQLKDTFLTRMTYFSAAKKEYTEDPLDDAEDQAGLTTTLNAWIAETRKAMEEAMPPQPASMVLHVAHRA